MTDASSGRSDVFTGKNLDEYARILQVDRRDLKNKDLYHFISRWLGSPHQMGGLTSRGIDCSAFVGILYKDVYAKIIPRSSREMGDLVKRKYENQLVEGDLIFFSFGGRTIDHVGVYLHNNKFVHVSTKKGVIISDLKDPWYYKYFTRAGTVKI